MKKILIVGSETSCHSPMMAALIKHISFDRINVDSSGLDPEEISPVLKKILQEIGVDISKEKPRPLNEFIHFKFDIIISTSEEARKSVDNLMSVTKIHKSFLETDEAGGSILDMEADYRNLREEMQEWLNEFIVRHRLI